jgi:citronellol/citronellal dehydrogenase
MADAAWQILTRDSRTTTGNFFIDEDVLAAAGVTDFSGYAVSPDKPLRRDLFLD